MEKIVKRFKRFIRITMSISEVDMGNLLSSWNARVTDRKFDSSYQDGVRDCLYELDQLVCFNSIPESDLADEDIEDYFLSQEADSIVSQMKEYAN